MPRPGTDVQITDSPPLVGAVLDTGQGFFLGDSQRGPTANSVALRSLREYERNCGPRSGGVAAHDAARAFFAERAFSNSLLHFARVTGPTARASSGTVGVLEAEARSPGTWGNTLTVALVVDSLTLAAHALRRASATPAKRTSKRSSNGEDEQPTEELTPVATAAPVPVRCVVALAGSVVERSPVYDSAALFVAWSERSAYIRLTAGEVDEEEEAEVGPIPAVTLTGGTDDRNITVASVEAALETFHYELGPGQVGFPGNEDPAVHRAIFAHCERMHRCPLVDLKQGDATLLAAEMIGLYGAPGVRMAAALAPALEYPGAVGGTTLVAYSAIQAGIIARQDRATGNPGRAPAGANGVSLYATGLARDYTDDEREELNELGVTLAKERFGQVRTYGSRTAAGPDDELWRWFAGSRVVMAIAHESDAAAEEYVHGPIDARGHRLTELATKIRGICTRFWGMEALYGATANDAFSIDVDSVNDVDTAKAGEMRVLIRLKTSPSAEWVVIEIVKTDIAADLTA